jgi:hypothetical protein
MVGDRLVFARGRIIARLLAVINLSIGDRYAARTMPLAYLLPIGDRYAAQTMPLAYLLPIGDRYAARTMP